MVAFCASMARADLREDLHAIDDRRGTGGQRLAAPSRPRPGTCGNWRPPTASRDSRNAECRYPAASVTSISIWPGRASSSCPLTSILTVSSLMICSPSGRRACSSTMDRPPFSIMYSNSCRKCFRKLCTGQAAASPKAQMVCPSILSATSSSRSRSSGGRRDPRRCASACDRASRYPHGRACTARRTPGNRSAQSAAARAPCRWSRPSRSSRRCRATSPPCAGSRSPS